jgi:hypothetical protein
MKLGARILKTGTAIVLALFLAELLKLPSPVFAGIAAIFAVQPSIYRSYLTIVEQIQGNIIGALCAILFYRHHYPFAVEDRKYDLPVPGYLGGHHGRPGRRFLLIRLHPLYHHPFGDLVGVPDQPCAPSAEI